MKQDSLFFDLNRDSGAIFSDCRKFRYVLWRVWDSSKPKAMFIGLNPSRANESRSDNTITKIGKVAAFNGFGGFYMMNLFSLVSPYPKDLKECDNPIMDNDAFLIEYKDKVSQVVFCWGVFKEAFERAEQVKKMFSNPYCFKITKQGFPWHPLYCKDATTLIPYTQ